LISARFDLLAFTLPALLALGLGAQSGALADPGGETPTWAWLLFVVFVDVAHVHATTLRVYCDRTELVRRPWLYGLTPLLGLVLGVSLYAASNALFWRCLAYIALFHFIRQQVGWLRLYRRRAQQTSALDARIDELAIYAATVCPAIVWHARLPTSFHWFVPGDFIAGTPAWLATAAVAGFIGCAALFYARQVQLALRPGHAVAWGKLWLVSTTAAIWWGGVVLMANDFAFTVTNVVAHGVPYMLISQQVARTRSVGHNSRYGDLLHFGLYMLALATLAFGEEWLWDVCVWREHADVFAFPDPQWELAGLSELTWLTVPLLALPQLTHYMLDAYLWRLDGNNPDVAQTLQLSARETPR
jgi:hypothetical protein